ncbi:hypothetical protein MBLNU230_g2019t1 [Neophaeotheca triangularis]
MPRTPTDATRFTATHPHISSQPSAFASNPTPSSSPTSQNPSKQPPSRIAHLAGPAPENETPQQKILRLRRAAAAARQTPEHNFDRAVRIGRVWADRVHRVTAWGLIGLTGVCGVVAAVGITDMLVHNRNRRNEWLAQKRLESARDLEVARRDLERGVANEEQVLLINRERVRVEAEEAKKRQPGLFKRVFGGGDEEGKEGEALVRFKDGGGEGEGKGMLGAAEETVQAVEARVQSERRSGERVTEVLRPMGGPLDREAEAATKAVVGTGESWTSWLTGR